MSRAHVLAYAREMVSRGKTLVVCERDGAGFIVKIGDSSACALDGCEATRAHVRNALWELRNSFHIPLFGDHLSKLDNRLYSWCYDAAAYWNGMLVLVVGGSFHDHLVGSSLYDEGDADQPPHVLRERATEAILAAVESDRRATADWEAVERAEWALASCPDLPEDERRLGETGSLLARERVRSFRANPTQSENFHEERHERAAGILESWRVARMTGRSLGEIEANGARQVARP